MTWFSSESSRESGHGSHKLDHRDLDKHFRSMRDTNPTKREHLHERFKEFEGRHIEKHEADKILKELRDDTNDVIHRDEADELRELIMNHYDGPKETPVAPTPDVDKE